MSRSDDSTQDMAGFPSPRDADLFFAGQLPPDDLPDDAGRLVELFASLRSHVVTQDPELERRTITAIADRNRSSVESVSGNIRSITRRVPARASALAFAAVLVTGTAAAAVTGSLPDRMQRAVSSVLSHAHISVPSPDGHADTPSKPADVGGPSRPVHHSPGRSRNPHGSSGAAGSNGVGPGGVVPGKSTGKGKRPAAVGPTGPVRGNPSTTMSNSPTTTVPHGPPTSTPGAGGVHAPPTTVAPSDGSGNGSGAQDGAGSASAHAQISTSAGS
jgi:hypothetical protein